MNYAKTVLKLREQILKFSGELSLEWPKVLRRFIAETIYGIQARQSVRLTEIARSLEERIALKKTQYRLCRQLGRRGLWAKITDWPQEGLRGLQPNAKNRESADESFRSLKFLGELHIIFPLDSCIDIIIFKENQTKLL